MVSLSLFPLSLQAMYLMHEICHAKQNEWPHSENTNCKVNRLGWKTTPPSHSLPPSSHSFIPLISPWTSRMGWMKKGLWPVN